MEAPFRKGVGGGEPALETLPGGPRDALGIRVGFASGKRGEREGVTVVLVFVFIRLGNRADPFICKELSTAE